MNDFSFTRKYKIRNPYKSDELVTQDVIVSNRPTLDYSNVPWVSIDTEFLTLDFAYDQLCVVQIASPDSASPEKLNIEIIWVWPDVKNEESQDLAKSFAGILERTDLEVIMHVSTADLPRIEKLANQRLQGKLFDTKAAGKLVIRNSNDHSMTSLIQQLIDPKFSQEKMISSSQWDTHPETWSDRVLEYTMTDVLYLHALKLSLEKIAERRGLTGLLSEVMEIMPTISELYKNGYTQTVLSY